MKAVQPLQLTPRSDTCFVVLLAFTGLHLGFLDKHSKFLDDALLVNYRGMQAIVITALERTKGKLVRVIELFFQGAAPQPPEAQLACDQRRRGHRFDIVTSGLCTCAAGFFVRHDLSFLASILGGGGAVRINRKV